MANQLTVVGFNEKVKSGKEKASFSGFGGKGLERLDAERDMARRRERKQFGEEGGDDAVEEVEAAEDTVVVTPLGGAVVAKVSTATGPSLDGEIVVHRRGTENALDRVKQAASAVDSRLKKNGELRSGVPIDNKGPDAGAYHATLEINDFPRTFPPLFDIVDNILITPQRKLDGPLRIARTSPRCSSRQERPSPRREATTLPAKLHSPGKIPSCTFWWREIRSLLLRTQ